VCRLCSNRHPCRRTVVPLSLVAWLAYVALSARCVSLCFFIPCCCIFGWNITGALNITGVYYTVALRCTEVGACCKLSKLPILNMKCSPQRFLVECDDHAHVRESAQQTAIAQLKAAAAACMYATPHAPLVYGMSDVVDLACTCMFPLLVVALGASRRPAAVSGEPPAEVAGRSQVNTHLVYRLVSPGWSCSCPVAICLYSSSCVILHCWQLWTLLRKQALCHFKASPVSLLLPNRLTPVPVLCLLSLAEWCSWGVQGIHRYRNS
jgi:hypothetical protein